MSLRNPYWGATQTELGASYLDTKTIVSIEEGYEIGTSNEFVKIGDFEVEEFINTGENRQQLRLNTTNPARRLQHNTTQFDRQFNSHVVFFDGFSNDDTITTNYLSETSDWAIGVSFGMITTRLLENRASKADSFILTNQAPLQNGIITVKIEGDDVADSSAQVPGVLFRGSGTESDFNGYHTRIFGAATNEVRLYRVVNGVGTEIGSGAFTPADDTAFWHKVVFHGNRLRVFTSTDGFTFTQRIDVEDDAFTGSGSVGLRAGRAASGILKFDDFDVVELGTHFTTGDALTNTLALGGIFGVSIATELDTFSDFVANSGSSWVAGTSNDITVHPTSGSSWESFLTSGATFDNFVIEVEMIGSSGNQAGLGIGNSDTFYVGYHETTSFRANNDVDNYLGNTRFTYQNLAPHVNVTQDRWYKLKMVKNDTFLGWYVNGILAQHIYGTSFILDTGLSNRVGVFAFQSGTSTVQFKNFKISSLDDTVDTISIPTNRSLDSVLDRYTPDGVAINWSSDAVNIFKIGESRGIHTLGLSNFKQGSNQDIGNVASVDYVSSQGTGLGSNVDGFVENDNARIRSQVDSSRIRLINDLSKSNATDLETNAAQFITRANRDLDAVSVTMPLRVDLEQYDKVDYVDGVLGISQRLIIYNQTKSFSSDGTTEHNLVLGI